MSSAIRTKIAVLLQETHVHGFPVANAEGDLVGIVTLSDVEDAALEHRSDATVGDICTRSLLVCHPDETLENVRMVRTLQGVRVTREEN